MFVELGRIASTPTDLRPAALGEELALLRSWAAPATVGEARPFLEEELGMPATQAERDEGGSVGMLQVAGHLASAPWQSGVGRHTDRGS